MVISAPPRTYALVPRKRLRTLAVTALSFVAGVLVVLAALMWIERSSTHWTSSFWSSLLGRTTRTDLTQPTVVDRIQSLQRLETIVYTMDKIVTGEKQSAMLPDFLAGDRLLLMVHGEVIAGIDFQMIKASDVRVDGKKVVVRMPQAQLLVTRLDSGRTRVYSRQTGLLVPTDPNLETEVRQEAEQDLQRSALADGILQKAQTNARSTITSLVQSLGYEDVRFE